jgi:ribonuclease III
MRPNSSQTGKRRRNRARGALKPPALEAEARAALEERLGHRFKQPELLDRALTHRSAAQGRAAEWSNERLEFLGDRLLGLVVAEAMLERFPLAREGELAPRLNSVVSRETCAVVGASLGVGEALFIDAGERGAGGAGKRSLMANAMEAIIGAVYVDGGLAAAKRFILRHWKEPLQATALMRQDPKSALQELAQGMGRPAPAYRHEGRTGPDHAPVFTATVEVDGLGAATGAGATKQEAERAAARSLMDRLQTVKT